MNSNLNWIKLKQIIIFFFFVGSCSICFGVSWTSQETLNLFLEELVRSSSSPSPSPWHYHIPESWLEVGIIWMGIIIFLYCLKYIFEKSLSIQVEEIKIIEPIKQLVRLFIPDDKNKQTPNQGSQTVKQHGHRKDSNDFFLSILLLIGFWLLITFCIWELSVDLSVCLSASPISAFQVVSRYEQMILNSRNDMSSLQFWKWHWRSNTWYIYIYLRQLYNFNNWKYFNKQN